MTRSDRWFLLGVFFVALIVGINVPVRAQTVPPFLIFGSPGSTSTPQVIKSTSNALWVSLQGLGAGTTPLCFTSSTCLSAPANGQLNITNNANTAGVGLDVTTDSTAYFRVRAQNSDADVKARSYEATATTSLVLAGKVGTYRNVTTAGWGVPAIQAQARAVAVVNTGTASVATYTVGAADGTFEVGCNVLVTVSTTHSFSCDTTYTDEGNTARTLVIPMAALAGTFLTNGLMTNVTGAGPYESPVMTIRAKAATAITIRTSAGGTFTTVTYNIDGTIKQVG